MKAPFFGKKNICKKPKIPPRKKDISFDRYKKRINTEVPEDLESQNSDEESSHVVGKFSDGSVKYHMKKEVCENLSSPLTA